MRARAAWIAIVCCACGGDGGAVFPDGAGGSPDGAAGSPDGAGPPTGWQSLAPLGAGPRQETGVAALGGRVYVIGGFDEGGNIVADVERYDPGTDTWESVAPLPVPLHHANVAAVGDRLWVVGSLRGIAFTPSGEVFVYDPSSDAWVDGTPMPAGSERGASGVAAIGAKIYVAGGTGGPTRFSSYDTSQGVWEALPDLPEPRNHLVAGAVGDVFYAIGGRDGGIEGHTARVDAFDTVGGAWSARAPMPTSRGGSAAAVVGARIVVAGGEGNSAIASGVFDNVEIYDATADAWEIAEPMPTPRHGTGAASIEGKVYVPGGADRRAFAAVDTVEVFVP